MTAPQRASGRTKLTTRSPEPRRTHVPMAAIYEFAFGEDPVFVWSCNHCESGTGQAPTRSLVHEAAEAHWRANHNHQEARA